MSIRQVRASAISGLRANGDGLHVVGDNLANINTPGYKEQRSSFEDVLGRALLGSGGDPRAGAGTHLAAARQVFSQGNLAVTGSQGDVALSGDGFLVVRGTVGGVTGDFYSRTGQLRLDGDGYLINSDGHVVQGWATRSNGTSDAMLGALRIATAALPPQATTALQVIANLDANAITPAAAWNVQSPMTTANFSTSFEIYDALGQTHNLDVYFRKESAGNWQWHAVAKAADTVGATSGTFLEVGSGNLSFGDHGQLASSSVTNPITIDFQSSPPGQEISLDFGPTAGTDQLPSGCTQFAGSFGVSSTTQNGYASGAVSGFEIDSAGVVSARSTNGENLVIGKLAIARFRANEGLGRASNGLWVATTESGSAALGSAGSGGRATVTHGAIEGSNISVSEELVELISYQSAFNASARVFATANAMGDALRDVGRRD